MILLLIYILFWFIIYYIEGTHDAYITKETNEHQPAKDYYKANFYKGKWHTWDSYQFAIFHIAFGLLISAFSSCSVTDSLDSRLLSGVEVLSEISYLKSVSLICISVSIRMIAHDLFYDLAMKRSIFTIPSCQGLWDWYDCSIVWIHKHSHIHPFFLRIIPLIITSIFYLYIT